MAPRTVHAHLEPPRHIAFHRLPVTAASESLRRRGSYLHQDRAHGRPHFNRARIKELTARYRLIRVIVLMAEEKLKVIRIIR
jgi:hypothetical protein